MPTLTETEDRLRRTLNAVASSVDGDGQPTRAADGLRALSAEIPSRPQETPVQRTHRPPRALAAVASAALVMVLIGVPAFLFRTASPGSPEDLAAGAPTTVEPTPTTTSSQIRSSEDSTGVDSPVEYPALTLQVPGWTVSEILESETQLGRVVSITFEETSEDSTGRVVKLELGVDGPWFLDFMTELENTGVDEQREVVTRGRDGLLWKSASGIWGLQWTESPAREGLLLMEHGDGPELLLQLGEALTPVNDEQWTEMVLSANPRTTVENQELAANESGTLPEDFAQLVNEGEEPLAWGTAGESPWVLAGWLQIVPNKPTQACTGVRPVIDEDWCTVPDGQLVYAQAFAVDDGGVIILRTHPGVSEIQVESDLGSDVWEVYGEDDGYPPTAVLATAGEPITGWLTPLDEGGDPLSEPIPFSFTEYIKTPAGG